MSPDAPASATADSHHSATLYQRYLAQCAEDIAALLAQVCREAGAAPAGGSIWVTPAQQQARHVLPTIAKLWADQLWQPVAAPAPAASAPMPFFSSDFGVPTGLSLMSDDDVDEDIESTRLVQTVEAAAEWSLRDLRSRLSGAPPLPGGQRDETLPIAPARVVGALCATLHREAVTPSVRLGALRTVADTLAHRLADLYQQHAEMLAEWGLQPARFTIRREHQMGSGGGARQGSGSGGGRSMAAAAGQIPALLAQVAGEARLSTGMQHLLARLAEPVSRSVAADKRLLESVDNPLWRLIDRLASLGQLDTDASAGGLQLPLHLRLEPIIARLEQAAGPMPLDHYSRALAEAEVEALGVAGADPASSPAAFRLSITTPQRLVEPTPAPALATTTTTTAARKPAAPAEADIATLMQAQMVARLRDDQVLPEVRQFLLGPWLQVVVKTFGEQGEEAPATQRVMGAVESLIDAGSHRRRAQLTRAELACLRMEAEDGLTATAVLPADRAQQHVHDLCAALATWPRPAPDTDFSPLLDDDDDDAPPDPLGWPSHDELATVPIALDAHNPDERSLRDCEAWLDTLGAGDICRIQRHGQWASLRLNWRSEQGTYFAFGNSTGLAFCASRRVLGRMRLEGLATTMARGHWVRRAVDTLPMPL